MVGNSGVIKKYLKKATKLESIADSKKATDKTTLESRYLRELLSLVSTINKIGDLDKLFETIIDAAIKLTRAERGFLILFDRNGNPEVKFVRNVTRETIDSKEFQFSRSIVNRVAETKKSIFLTDVYTDETFRIKESIIKFGLRMVMCVPLFVKEHFFGLIYVDSKSPVTSFTQLERQILETFAAQASIALENSYLYNMTIKDSLTELYNYNYLCLRLGEEIEKLSRYAGRVIEDSSLMMIDIDGFKSINDIYGHIIGNKVLRQVADILKESLRKVDIITRYGGDEFAVLMPETDSERAYLTARRLIEKIQERPFFIGADKIQLTLSIGVSTISRGGVKDITTVIMEADNALYQSKKKGGNCVTVFAKKEDIEPEPGIIAKSQIMNKILSLAERFAKTDVNILITGETGVGKEIITRYIHNMSHRRGKPFVVVNCGAIPETLLESELFGYAKGAFTGAYKEKKGMFELANGGTIFLDEICELPFSLQAKLLRVIETKEIEKIGREKSIKCDVRIIAASNRDLQAEIAKKKFREDLFYRLNVANIFIPPLRDHPEDIPVIAEQYLQYFNKKYSKNFKGFTDSLIRKMLSYSWPGNIRELIYRIERAVIISTNEYLTIEDFEFPNEFLTSSPGIRGLREKIEFQQISEVLRRNNGNISKTARELKMSRNTLKKIIKKMSLSEK